MQPTPRFHEPAGVAGELETVFSLAGLLLIEDLSLYKMLVHPNEIPGALGERLKEGRVCLCRTDHHTCK